MMSSERARTGEAKPWRSRVGRWALIGGLVASLALTVWCGWWSPPGDWLEASGWQQVPQDAWPINGATIEAGGEGSASLWTAGPGDVPPPRLRWLGHAGFVIEWRGKRLLLDPNISPWCTVSRRRQLPPDAIEGLGPVDAVLISHAHFDHLDLPTLARLRHVEAVLLPVGSEDYLRESSWRAQAVPLAVGDRWSVPTDDGVGLEIIATEAQHNGNRWHPFNSHHGASSYIIRSGDTAIYFAGDSGFGDHFAAIGRAYHPRLAILPIGAYAPRFPLARYHLSPEEAVEAARRLGAEIVVPAHFGTFTLSLDRPSSALPRFAMEARRREMRWWLAPLWRSSLWRTTSGGET
jgi:L-ascorbate metabolism protein UlaG (beta-lactamase superfamily)